MVRLGLSPDSTIGARIKECGFDVWIRDDGLWAEGLDGFSDQKRSPYNGYLKSKGYRAENPWHDNANAGVSDDGDIASGFLMIHADKPANIREEDSETPWLTGRTIDFIKTQKGGGPWCAHVSFIKPHPLRRLGDQHSMPVGFRDQLCAKDCHSWKSDLVW